MNTNQIKTIISAPNNYVMSHDISLHQRNLSAEVSTWLKQVEAKAKQLKAGKVVLIAVLIND